MGKKSFYFDPYAGGTAVFMGPTEARLMDLAWEKKSLTVKEALFYLGRKSDLAYTTVMTILGRLADKGLLKKTRDGRQFVYTPAIDKAEFLKQRIRIVNTCLRNNFPK
ncbi:MAG: BlaI/MecI/CopY family transcriptional regulator [candidate division Zixibacteria bacterium]|nr:BlaI/MecI/CopY family transcriptional regulator [candidate division Zixibacteria bacterium]